MSRIAVRARVTRVDVDGGVRRTEDLLAAEEPLEIRVGGRSLVVTMRTPGHDVELAQGAWLLAPVQADLIFDTSSDVMWEAAIRRLGAEPSMLHGSSGVH